MSNGMTASLRSALKTQQSIPIGWRTSLAVLVGIIFSAGLGLLLDNLLGGKTVIISFITGMFLALVAVTGPFFMALRLVAVIGALMALTSGLAVLAIHHAWIAVAGMVLLVFISTVWTALPMVGGLLGSFPTICYLLIIARGEAFTGGASAGRVMLASAVSIVAALGVLVVFSGRDVRKTSRGLVARAWGPTASWAQHGQALTILRLDAAPAALVTSVQAAILAMIARGWLTADNESEAYKAGLSAQESIVKTVMPPGRLVPRTIEPPIDESRRKLKAESVAAGQSMAGYAWNRWDAALGYGSGVLAGTVAPNKVIFSSSSMTGALFKSIMHPQSSAFRYGIQRALALGVATFVMIKTQAPDFYWVLLAMFSVMQTNAIATLSRAAQYAFGTWIGAVGALALSAVVPHEVVSVLALGLIIAGFAWMTRNYTVMCVGVAAAVVLLTGSPDGDYLKWAGLRALDVTIGALVAVAVSAFVLRVRPDPARHIQEAQAALLSSMHQIKARLENPGHDSEPALVDEVRFFEASANINADTQMLHDHAQVDKEHQELWAANNQVLSIASVVFESEGRERDLDTGTRDLIQRQLERVVNEIHGIGKAPTNAA